MAAATAAADPPGYFVGRPLHYQEQPQPQTVPAQPPSPPSPAPAVDEHNAVNAAQVPGYYAGRVQQRRGEDTENNTINAVAADQQNREQGFFTKLFGCFYGSS